MLVPEHAPEFPMCNSRSDAPRTISFPVSLMLMFLFDL